MGTNYRHTQYGVLMFIVFLLAGILIAFVVLAIIGDGRTLSAILMVCVYLFGLGMFYSFTIEVTEEKLKFWFGIGILKKAYALSEVQSIRVIVNPWYFFWGVKSISGGWFYAIAPGSAVEIVLNNGKIVQLGTNQPKKLKQTLDTARQRVGQK